MNYIINRFKENAVERGGLLFFPPEIAINIVKSLEEGKIRILGLDAFSVTENTTQPVMEHSVDLSLEQDAWNIAIAFLGERIASDLVFEITVDE